MAFDEYYKTLEIQQFLLATKFILTNDYLLSLSFKSY